MKVYLTLLIALISFISSREKSTRKKSKSPFEFNENDERNELNLVYQNYKRKKDMANIPRLIERKENFKTYYSELRTKLNFEASNDQLKKFNSLAYSIWDMFYTIQIMKKSSNINELNIADNYSDIHLPNSFINMSVFLLHNLELKSKIQNATPVVDLTESILNIRIIKKPEVVATILANNLLELIVPKKTQNTDLEESMMGLIDY